jgi:hypothetical protein
VDSVTNEELLTVLEARFDAIDARFERMETSLRHVNVQIEGLWGETKRLAEYIALVDEKLERFRAETYTSFGEQRAFNQMLVTRLQTM